MSGKPFVATRMDIAIGRAIRIARVKVGMTQKDLARAVDVTFQQIQKYETAGNRVSAVKLYRMAQMLGVPVASLYNNAQNLHSYDQKVFALVEQFYKLSPSDQKLIQTLIKRLS